MSEKKSKLRFTSFDLSAVINQLTDTLSGRRLKNFYDLSPNTYIFKFIKGQQRHNLIVQVGIRIHLTQTQIQKDRIPSAFSMKFRKALRGRRLDSIKQVGMQRVCILQFIGEKGLKVNVIMQFYSQGNLILADHEYRIIALTRSHVYDDQNKTSVGQLYPFKLAAKIYLSQIKLNQQIISNILRQQQQRQKKKSKKVTLTSIIQKAVPCLFQQIIQHQLQKQGINGSAPAKDYPIQKIFKISSQFLQFCKQFKKNKHFCLLAGDFNQKKILTWYQFGPIDSSKSKLFPQQSQKSNFNQGVDQYYKQLKRTGLQQGYQEIAWKKYQQIKEDQTKRIQKLKSQQQLLQYKANLIQLNVQDVDIIISVISQMQQNKMSWDDITKDVTSAKRSGDPFANIIHRLALNKNQVVLMLGDPLDQFAALFPIQIELGTNAYNNVRQYYQRRRKDQQKQSKTKQASQNVLKVAQQQALKQIQKKKAQIIKKQLAARKLFWFEKYHWFLTSQHYLVICGRDVHQNQAIVKRHLDKYDLYFHADYGGAASVVLKNPRGKIVPQASLEQAANFAVCRSKSWDNKIISGAWWVYANQVSKSAPTGQFLPAGSFMIRGKKNFIKPHRLQMCLILLFKLSKQSAKQRRQKAIQLEVEMQKIELRYQQDESCELVQMMIQKKGKKQVKKVTDNRFKKQKQKNIKGKQKKNQLNSQKEQQQQQQQQLVYQKKSKIDKNKNKQEQNSKNKQQKKKKIKQKKLEKIKKYQEEYSDQDRQIRMNVVGAQKLKSQQIPNTQIQIIKQNNTQNFTFFQNQQPKQTKPQLNKSQIPFFYQQPQNSISASSQSQQQTQPLNKQEQQIKQQEPTNQQIQDIYQLSTTLQQGQQFQYFVPMSAPNITYVNPTNKIKLVPGTFKKGKAARSSLVWFKKNIQDIRSKKALQGLDEQEVINVMPMNVRLAGAGILKQEQQQKLQKKKLKKEEQKKKKK